MKKFDQFLQQLTFNVRRDKEIDLNRRGFIASSMGLMGLMFVAGIPLVSQAGKRNGEDSEKAVKVSETDELAIGDSKTFSYLNENDPAMIIRINQDEYRAYHIKCTHLQCPVYYDKPTNQMVCPCHHGFFSVENGAVLAGPPQRPLPAIRLEQRQDGIYAVGIDGPE